MNNEKVVIVGAGPGGLTAGKMLADAGKDVLILEKNPRDRIGDKTCAGGLPPHTMERIPDEIIENKVDTGNIIIGGKKVSFSYYKPVVGFVSRLTLGQWQLKEAEKSGCLVKPDSKVLGFDSTKKEVNLADGSTVEYDYLIGADGSNSVIRRSLGFTRGVKGVAVEYTVPNNGNLNDCELYIDAGKLGLTYGWIFPHGDYASVGTGSLPELMSVKSVEDSFVRLMEQQGVDLHGKEVVRRVAPLYMTYHGFSHVNDTVFLVGDAASFVWVPTGEGIYQAMKSGELAAKKILGITDNYDYELLKLELYPCAFGWILPIVAMFSGIIRPMIKIFGPPLTNIAGFLCEAVEKRSYLKDALTSVVYPLADSIIGCTNG